MRNITTSWWYLATFRQLDWQVKRVSQEYEPKPMKQVRQDKGFDEVRVKNNNFDSFKSVIFDKLKSSICQRRTQIIYKIDLRADDNLK